MQYLTSKPIKLTVADVCRRRHSSVGVCNTARRNVTNSAGAARDGGPVVLRPVRATPCLIFFGGIFIDAC